MKKKLSTKIISSLLILAFLISAFTVFSFAENTDGSGDVGANEDMDILYNRTFDEGWDYTNGLTEDNGGNRYSIDNEIDVLGNYNYFVRAEALTNNSGRIYYDFKQGAYVVSDNTVAGTVIELSVKADDVATVGRILHIKTGSSKTVLELLSIDKDGHLIVFPTLSAIKMDLGLVEDEWINVAFAFDWSSKVIRNCTVYYSYGAGAEYTGKKKLNYEKNASVLGISEIAFGVPPQASRPVADSLGMNVCFDNIKVYQGVNIPVAIDENNKGLSVNTNEEKVIDIRESANDKTATELLEESLAMKLGVDYALVRNEKQAIYDGTYGAPEIKDGKIMVPFELLVEYIGFPYFVHPDGISYDITTGITGATYITIDRKTAAVAGKTVELSVAPTRIPSEDNKNSYVAIALEDIPTIFPGWLSLYDDMGLIIIYQDTTPDNLDDNAPIVTRENDLDAMVDIMKRFVFNTVDAYSAKDGYIATGEKVYNDVKTNTNNFKHPYLMANQTVFNNLADKYAAQDTDATLKAYLQAIVDNANAIYNENANVVSGAYSGIKADKVPVNVYSDGKNPSSTVANDKTVEDTDDGYSAVTGRIDNIVEYADVLPTLALAYQITGNVNYALLAYDWSVALASWQHWGPAYFEDLAEVAYAFAVSYDWLYNAYVANSKNVDVLANAIYNLGVYDAYNASSGAVCEHPSAKGDKSNYTAETDSTNAVATSSMIVASLAVLDYVDEKNREDALEKTVYVIGNNMKMLVENGLAIYAPDGSHVESATGWERGTSKFVNMVASLMSAAGTDYGFMDVWGVYESCYYAIHIESSDGLIWNYHDAVGDGVTSGDIPVINTDMFNFIGAYYGDSNLIAVRNEQIAEGKSVSIYDLIFYPFGVTAEKEELPLDYYMEGLDAYVSRSDWNAGAMYAGLMGGANNSVGGQIDSGNFIYHNKGIVWFMDLGGEEESVFEYDVESAKYKYYRATAQGQNTVVVTDILAPYERPDVKVPTYGQFETGSGSITKTFENDHGSYVILDNKSAYGPATVSAMRGMLVTNDRSTVVIQDEITFSFVADFYWVAHTAQNIELSEDSKTAYLTGKNANGELYTLRATLISSFNLSFRVMDANATLPASGLSINSSNHSTGNGGTAEFDRNALKRLVIFGDNMLVATLAVVFEIVENSDSTAPVGYEWAKMNNWEPLSADSGSIDTSVRLDPKVSDIKTATSTAESLLKRDDVFTDRLEALYRELTLVEYTYQNVEKDDLESAIKNAYLDYLDAADEYNDYLEYVNDTVSAVNGIANALMGLD